MTDTMVDLTEKQDKEIEAKMVQQSKMDNQRLKEELGASYDRKNANVKQFLSQSGLDKEEVASLAFTIGKYKTWKLFDKLSHYTTDGERVSANARNTRNSSDSISKDFMDKPDFYKRLNSGDKEALRQMNDYVSAMAKQPLPEVL